MKRIFQFALFIFIASGLYSCKEKIDLNIPPGETKLVVEAEITTETDSSFVKLTKTAYYYSNDPYPAVSDATVSVNGVPFTHTSNGIYRPLSPYTGQRGQIYKLTISHDGNTYTSSAVLEPMFRVDSIFQVFKPREGFIPEGYSINYLGFDDRPKIKYTYFRLGHFDTIAKRDTFDDMKVLFDSDLTPVNQEYSFELPFTRFKVGEECLMIFRSVDRNMYDFIMAYSEQTSGAPGPFQAPPANLPTNITGGAIGYFATYDVVRRRYTVK